MASRRRLSMLLIFVALLLLFVSSGAAGAAALPPAAALSGAGGPLAAANSSCTFEDAPVLLHNERIVWRHTMRPNEPFSQILVKFHVAPTAPVQVHCDEKLVGAIDPLTSPGAEGEDAPLRWQVLTLPGEQPAGAVCELSSISDFEVADERYSQSAGGLKEVTWYDDYDARPRFLPKFQTTEEGCDRGMCLGLRRKYQDGTHTHELDGTADVLRFRTAPQGKVAAVEVALAGDGAGRLRVRLSDTAEDCHWIDPQGRAHALHPVPGSTAPTGGWREAELRLIPSGGRLHEVVFSVGGVARFRGFFNHAQTPSAFTSVSFTAEGGVLLDDFVAGVAAPPAPADRAPAKQPETQQHPQQEQPQQQQQPPPQQQQQQQPPQQQQQQQQAEEQAQQYDRDLWNRQRWAALRQRQLREQQEAQRRQQQRRAAWPGYRGFGFDDPWRSHRRAHRPRWPFF